MSDLRDRIAATLHEMPNGEDCDPMYGCEGPQNHLAAADAVVALLGLTEYQSVVYENCEPQRIEGRLVGPWYPVNP